MRTANPHLDLLDYLTPINRVIILAIVIADVFRDFAAAGVISHSVGAGTAFAGSRHFSQRLSSFLHPADHGFGLVHAAPSVQRQVRFGAPPMMC